MVSITDNDLLFSKIRFYRIYPSYFYVDPYSEEWDEIGGNILVKATERRNFLLSLNVYMKRDLKRLYVIIGRLDKLNIKYTADDVIRSFRNKMGEQSFLVL